MPGELEHASGEVDEVEASHRRGRRGRRRRRSVDDAELARRGRRGGSAPRRRSATSTADEARRASRRRTGGHDTGPEPQGNRVLNFLRACWAELQRVQWPDRRQVAQATAVVLGFVVLAGAYLGVADWAAQRVVDFIL